MEIASEFVSHFTLLGLVGIIFNAKAKPLYPLTWVFFFGQIQTVFVLLFELSASNENYLQLQSLLIYINSYSIGSKVKVYFFESRYLESFSLVMLKKRSSIIF